MRSNGFDIKGSIIVRGLYLREACNCENKASLLIYFKNSFAWLTGMKKVIFGYNNFFGVKKVIVSKNCSFHTYS